MINLRVWWVPQVPLDAFYVEVGSIEEAVKIMDILANYDAFQYETNIKPDYSNAGGVQMFEDGSWIDWEDYEYGFDDPREYLEFKEGSNETS